MRNPITRRQFLTYSAALGATALLPWPAWADSAIRRPRSRRSAVPSTYFPLSEAGRDLDHPITGLSKRVRILLGSAAGASNSLVYADEKGSLLIDVATCALGRLMVQDALAVGGPFGTRAPDSGLDAVVINTHHHQDHTGGNFALADFGTRPLLVMHSVGEQRVRSGIQKYRDQVANALRGTEAITDPARREQVTASARAFIERADLLSPDDFGPTRTFNEERYEVQVGQTVATLHFFGPGHTDNDTVIQLYEDDVIHTGDLLFAKMHPYFADDSGATCQGWINSVSRIIDLCADTTVIVPGHGPVCDVTELRRQMSYLMQLWEVVGAEIDKGTTREAATAMSWPFMDGLEREQLRPRAIGAVYDEIIAGR